MSPMTGVDPDLALAPVDDPLLTAPVVAVLSRKLAAKPAVSSAVLPHRRLAADDLSTLPPLWCRLAPVKSYAPAQRSLPIRSPMPACRASCRRGAASFTYFRPAP